MGPDGEPRAKSRGATGSPPLRVDVATSPDRWDGPSETTFPDIHVPKGYRDLNGTATTEKGFPNIHESKSGRSHASRSARPATVGNPHGSLSARGDHMYGDGFALPELSNAEKSRQALRRDAAHHRIKYHGSSGAYTDRGGRFSPDKLLRMADELRVLGQDREIEALRETLARATATAAMNAQAHTTSAATAAGLEGGVKPSERVALQRMAETEVNRHFSTREIPINDAAVEEASRLKRELEETRVQRAVESEKRKREEAELENHRLKRDLENTHISKHLENEKLRREDMEEEIACLKRELEQAFVSKAVERETLRCLGVELEKKGQELERKREVEKENMRLKRELENSKTQTAVDEERMKGLGAELEKKRFVEDENNRLKSEYEEALNHSRRMGDEAQDARQQVKDASSEENHRLRRELQDRHSKVSALEATVVSYITAKERAKARATFLRLYGLSGRFMLYDISCAMRFWMAWLSAHAMGKLEKTQEQAKKDSEAVAELKGTMLRTAMKQMERANGADRTGAMLQAFQAWLADLAEVKKERALAEEEARSRLLAASARAKAVEMALGKQGIALVAQVFRSWEEEVAAEKKVKMMKDKAMAKGLRAIAGSEASLKEVVLLAWLKFMDLARMEKANEHAREQLERMRASKLAAVERSLNMTGKAKQKECFVNWKDIKKILERKEKAMAQAGRLIANSQKALMTQIVNGWEKSCSGTAKALVMARNQARRLLTQMIGAWIRCLDMLRSEREMEKQNEAANEQLRRMREQKLAAVERSLNVSGRAKVKECFSNWKDIKKILERREKAMAQAGRLIANSQQALMTQVVNAWEKSCSGTAKALVMERNQQKRLLTQMVMAWVRFVDLTHREREAEKQNAGAMEQLRRMREQKLQAVERSLNVSGKAMMKDVFVGWRDAKKNAERREKAMAQAGRLIANSQTALMTQVVNAWEKSTSGKAKAMVMERNKQKRLLTQMVMAWVRFVEDVHREKELAKQNEGALEQLRRMREQKLQAVERSLNVSGKAMMKDVFVGWRDAKKNAERREKAMAQAGRLIANSQTALMTQVVNAWEKSTEGKAKAMVMARNREKHLKTQCIVGWSRRTLEIKQEEKLREQRTAMVARNYVAGQQALVQDCFVNWRDAKKIAERKEKAMAQAGRLIANSQQALMTQVVNAWEKSTSGKAKALVMERNTQKRLVARMMTAWGWFMEDIHREKQDEGALAQLKKMREQKLQAVERSLNVSGKAKMKDCFIGWRDAKKNAERREKAMAQAGRLIANSQSALMTQVVNGWEKMCSGTAKALVMARNQDRRLLARMLVAWSRGIDEQRRSAEAEKAKERLERMRAQKLQAVERQFNLSGWAKVKECVHAWISLLEAARLARTLKDRGMASSLKRIADTEGALKAESFLAWTTAAKDWKNERLLNMAEVAAANIKKARARAIAALEKTLKASDETLRSNSFGGWKDEVEKVKLNKRRKDLAAAHALRTISGSESALKATSFGGWTVEVRQGKLDKKLARNVDLGRSAYVRLRKELMLRKYFEAWLTRANPTGDNPSSP